MSADEVSGWLAELLQLSRTGKRSEVERKRVEELCRSLRGAGYTNKWLEITPREGYPAGASRGGRGE